MFLASSWAVDPLEWLKFGDLIENFQKTVSSLSGKLCPAADGQINIYTLKGLCSS